VVVLVVWVLVGEEGRGWEVTPKRIAKKESPGIVHISTITIIVVAVGDSKQCPRFHTQSEPMIGYSIAKRSHSPRASVCSIRIPNDKQPSMPIIEYPIDMHVWIK
jgi:hypothetical protein